NFRNASDGKSRPRSQHARDNAVRRSASTFGFPPRLLAAHFAQAQVGGSGKLELDGTRQAGGFVPIVEPKEDVQAVAGEGEELPYHLGLVGGRTGGDGHLLDPTAAPVEVTPGSAERGLEIVGAVGVHAVVNETDLQQFGYLVQNPSVGQGDARVLVQ